MSKDDRNTTVKAVAIGGMIAAAAGYVAGLLTAPKSGKETREDIKHAANETYSKAEAELKNLNRQLSDLIEQGKDQADKLGTRARGELNYLIDSARDAKDKVREVISAIHEGDAEDRDLKKAVNDAKKAIDNLNKYLRK